MSGLGVVTGLAFEARLFRRGWGRDAPATHAAPGRHAADAALALHAGGAAALLSFGTAGGLDPALRPGTLVMATAVMGTSSRFRLPAPHELGAALGAVTGAVLTVDAPLATAAAKTRARETGAVAVDMESARVAEVGARLGLPVLVVRAVTDPAGRRLPGFAAEAVDEAGRLRPWRIARALLTTPGDWPATARAAGDGRRAATALRGAAAALALLTREGALQRFLDVPLEDVARGPLL